MIDRTLCPSTRIAMISGDEYDLLTREARRYHLTPAGRCKAVKRRYRRRYRAQVRLALRWLVGMWAPYGHGAVDNLGL
jgi:hypothetical protein